MNKEITFQLGADIIGLPYYYTIIIPDEDKEIAVAELVENIKNKNIAEFGELQLCCELYKSFCRCK